MKALPGIFEIQSESHFRALSVEEEEEENDQEEMINKKGPVKSKLMNLCGGMWFEERRGGESQAFQSLMTEKLNGKQYLQQWAGTAPHRELMETWRAFRF